MFDQLFRYPGVVRRHRDGPLAHERAAYLASLATRGSAPGTLLKCSRYCLAIAHVVAPTSRDRSFSTSEIDVLARTWAAGRVRHRRAAAPRWPHEHFRAIAMEFLKWLGRWTPPPTASCPYFKHPARYVTGAIRALDNQTASIIQSAWYRGESLITGVWGIHLTGVSSPRAIRRRAIR